uniref:Cytochrome P450 n=1 Tax=Anopheles minimus TaxID=112268 RepID=A0A182VYB0_9DIPT
MITLWLLGVGILSLYVYCKIKFKFAEKIPRVEPLHPIFGNGLEFAQKNSYEIFKSLSRAYDNDKRIFKLSFGPIPVICPTHPDLIQKIMTEPVSMDKPFVYDFMRVNHGLLTAQYDEWRVHRKALNPTFNTRILNSFIPIFTDCVEKMISNLHKHENDQKPINMLEFTSPCTLEMICRTSLGGKVLEREGKQEFIEGLEIILHNVGLRIFNANLYPDFVYKNTRFYRAEMAARKICYAFTDKVIREKRAKFEERLRSSVDSNNNSAMSDENGNVVFADEEDDMLNYKKPQIFVDQLLTIPNDGKPFTHEEITDHIYTMIAAGNETSATQAAHACLLLAMHPEVQERAAAEVRELLADDVEYTHEILKQMEYLDLVIKESQRLCPVAAVFGRKTTGPIQLDEFVIPKGFILLLNPFTLHRKKEFWGPNADKFDPDNFLPERVKARHPYAYLPFSGGPRGCIGNRYAMMSLKIMLSQILKNFKLTTEIPYEKLDFKFKVSMHLSFEHLIKLEPRVLCTGTMDYRKTFSVLLLLWGSLQGYAKISPKVISLQQVLYSELQTLEKSALVTHPTYTTPNEGVLYRLRSVFHEFERQNQESITAILRVLALVDHTLENTIQDCEKVFHLPSLDSENVLFRDVTRPLLLHVEALCQQIASKDLDEIEATMVTVEQEANSYRIRLDETKRNMQIVLQEVDNGVESFSIRSKVDELFNEIELINSTIHRSIVASVENLRTRQQSICDEILQIQGTNDDANMAVAIESFMEFLDNETELLVEDLAEQLDDWFNQTANMINAVEEEMREIPRDLMESPVESFLQNESSLKCLAEYSTRKAVENMRQGLESILHCFIIANDTERPFEMAYNQLTQTDGDIQQTLQDILHCHQSTVRDDYNVDDFGNMASCFEMTKPILEALQDFVDSKMDEIFFHVDISMYYNELKMETCVYYKAREMMLSLSSINHQYQKCNMENEIEL